MTQTAISALEEQDCAPGMSYTRLDRRRTIPEAKATYKELRAEENHLSLSIREGSLEQVACELDPDRQVLR